MPSARESRAALQLLTAAAVATGQELFQSTTGSPEERRLQLLDGVPQVIAYYADGSAALAADFYDEVRAGAQPRTVFSAEMITADRTVKIRRAVAWASQPMIEGDDAGSPERLAEVIQLETARPYRDTITTNRQRDPDAVGWKRIASGGCKFCQMLAARGAVYREKTAHFASHPNCHCTAAPVFRGGEDGPEADVMQYVASRRSRTPAQRAMLREYLNEHFPDVHG